MVRQGLTIGDGQIERLHSCVLPHLEAILDPVRGADEAHLVNQFIRHRPRRGNPFSRQIEILNLARLVLISIPTHEVVVEVSAPCPHSSDVQRQVWDAARCGLWRRRPSRRAVTIGAMSNSSTFFGFPEAAEPGPKGLVEGIATPVRRENRRNLAVGYLGRKRDVSGADGGEVDRGNSPWGGA